MPPYFCLFKQSKRNQLYFFVFFILITNEWSTTLSATVCTHTLSTPYDIYIYLYIYVKMSVTSYLLRLKTSMAALWERANARRGKRLTLIERSVRVSSRPCPLLFQLCTHPTTMSERNRLTLFLAAQHDAIIKRKEGKRSLKICVTWAGLRKNLERNAHNFWWNKS